MPLQFLDHTTPGASQHSAVDQASAVTLAIVGDDGWLHVVDDAGHEFACLWLESVQISEQPLQAGDRLLAMRPTDDRTGIVLGRIGVYRLPTPRPRVTVEATDFLTLKCGEASIDLRADGKVVIRGEDVLLRAKGTQRIRAGTVSIN